MNTPITILSSLSALCEDYGRAAGESENMPSRAQMQTDAFRGAVRSAPGCLRSAGGSRRVAPTPHAASSREYDTRSRGIARPSLLHTASGPGCFHPTTRAWSPTSNGSHPAWPFPSTSAVSLRPTPAAAAWRRLRAGCRSSAPTSVWPRAAHRQAGPPRRLRPARPRDDRLADPAPAHARQERLVRHDPRGEARRLQPAPVRADPIRNLFDGGPDDDKGENSNNAMLFFLQERVEVLRETVHPDAGVVLCHTPRRSRRSSWPRIPSRRGPAPAASAASTPAAS